VSRLSGGERARVLIAQLMLQPADLLLLDEPTNDLDIPTLEILEESLLEFRGALVLVTHDRYMLDRVSSVVLGLDGYGGAGRFASYSQWDAWQTQQQKARNAAAKAELARGQGTSGAASSLRAEASSTASATGKSSGKSSNGDSTAGSKAGVNPRVKPSVNLSPGTTPGAAPAKPAAAKKRLSFSEVREFETIQQRIADAEKELESEVASLSDATVASDAALLRAATLRIDELHRTIENLYSRWAELEQKQA
jgi:ATP-binding cassette subfamily F protein uup